MIKLFRSYLAERFQCVENGEYLSPLLPMAIGVPQGSVLGPLLFSLFINDLPDALRFSKPHMFADNFQNYVHSDVNHSALGECVAGIKKDLIAISHWATRQILSVEWDKSGSYLQCKKS